MKNQGDWKLYVLMGVIFLILYPIQQRLLFGADSLVHILGAGLTGGISMSVAFAIQRLLFRPKKN